MFYPVTIIKVKKMSDKLFDAMFTGACILAIVVSAIFGSWALLVTMSL